MAKSRSIATKEPRRRRSPQQKRDWRKYWPAKVRLEVPHPVYEGEIRLLAYYKWDAAGRPSGDGRTFWLEAEKELMQDFRSTASSTH